MNLSPLLDALLTVVLLGYVTYGMIRGFTRCLLVMAGILVSVTSALLVTPLISGAIAEPDLRVMAIVATSVGLIALGHTIGHTISNRLRLDNVNRALRLCDCIAGGLVIGLFASMVLSTNSSSVGQLGSPFVSRTFAGSAVINTLHRVTPRGVEAQVLQLRAGLSADRVPVFAEDFGSHSVDIPNGNVDSASLSAAAESVVRITGNSYACGQSRSGTGFVVADDRIITNAHVVAGTRRPVIEALNGQVLVGTVVYFDVNDDLAVVAVSGLDARPLSKGLMAQEGDSAQIVGYPFGGPITSTAAQVQSTRIFDGPNIYLLGEFPREAHMLAGQVSPGDSGGPLLSSEGDFVGMVFARATDRANVGYAMTLTELGPAVDRATTLTEPVSSGECIRD